MDAHATKVCTGYTGIVIKRAQNVKVMWDRQFLNANAVHWRFPHRPKGHYMSDHLHDEPEVWGQLCECHAVEEMGHVLGLCDNDTYK